MFSDQLNTCLNFYWYKIRIILIFAVRDGVGEKGGRGMKKGRGIKGIEDDALISSPQDELPCFPRFYFDLKLSS